LNLIININTLNLI